MAHVWQLIAKNNAYTLAEVSENPFEAWIKPYRYARNNQARQTSIQHNNADCLKTMYLPSRQDIRKFEDTKSAKTLRDDDVSKTIQSFFYVKRDILLIT